MAGLSQTQKSMITKARTLGSGSNRVRLDDAASSYLLAVIVEDLRLREHFPELSYPLAPFFRLFRELRTPGVARK